MDALQCSMADFTKLSKTEAVVKWCAEDGMEPYEFIQDPSTPGMWVCKFPVWDPHGDTLRDSVDLHVAALGGTVEEVCCVRKCRTATVRVNAADG
jgi:hypothetical protein